MKAPHRKHVPQTIVDRRQALVRNIERTLRLIELNAPDVIIGNDIALTFARACAVYPDAAKAYADRLIQDSRRNCWLCDMCDAELANDEEKSLGTCRTCLDSCQIDHDGQEPL